MPAFTDEEKLGQFLRRDFCVIPRGEREASAESEPCSGTSPKSARWNRRKARITCSAYCCCMMLRARVPALLLPPPSPSRIRPRRAGGGEGEEENLLLYSLINELYLNCSASFLRLGRGVPVAVVRLW